MNNNLSFSNPSSTSALSLTKNPVVAYLQKPAAELTKADIVRYVCENDIQMIIERETEARVSRGHSSCHGPALMTSPHSRARVCARSPQSWLTVTPWL